MKKLAALLLVLLLPLQLFSQQRSGAQSKLLVLTHVNVIDMTGAPARPDMTVVIDGNRIVALGKTGRVRVPLGAQLRDATGKFLIPGLWDMHVHIRETERTFPLFIANGVMGVRNMGGKLDDLLRWRAEVASGALLGPRILACGPIVDGPEPVAHGEVVSVKTPADARQIVNSLKERGADFIKVYDTVPRDAYYAIADEAKKLHMPFVGHVPSALTALEASDAGQKSMEHLGTILEGCSTAESELRNWPKTEMKPGDFSAIPARIAAQGQRMLDTYSEARARRLFARLARNGTWQVPTLVVKRSLTFVDDISKIEDARFKYIPESDRQWWGPTKNFLSRYRTPEYIVYRKREFQKEMEIVGAMRRAGVEFMTGTDFTAQYVYPGFSLHEEMALLVKAGFTPMEALQAATRNPAKFLGELASSGTIERGKLANLVLLDANPLENISNTQRINAVIVNGRYLSKEFLQRMLADVETSAAKK